MRLLAGFVLICLALLALATWFLVRDTSVTRATGIAIPSAVPPTAPPTRPQPAVSGGSPPPPVAASPAPATTHSVSASQPTVTVVAALPEQVSTKPATRWAADPDIRAAQQRLAAARRVLQDDPHHEVALRDELEALATLERWHEAVLTLGRLLELHPDDTDLRSERAALLLQLERAVEAVADLEHVVERQPERAHAWFNLAVAHQALGHLADAERAWTRAIVLEPSAEAHAQRGQVRLDLRAWAKAASDFEAVLQTEPDAVDAAMNLSRAYELLGRNADARRCLAGLLERKPRCLPALNRLAELTWIASQSATHEQATFCSQTIDLCRRSLAVNPRQPDVESLLAEVQRTTE